MGKMKLFNLILCSLAFAVVKSDGISHDVDLLSQQLHLTFTEESFKPPYQYQGHLWMRISLYSSYSGDFQMYAAHDFITVESATLEVTNLNTTENLTVLGIDSDTDILTLGGTEFAKSFTWTPYLNIYYTSRISTEDLNGLYLANYSSNGQVKNMIATQFQPTFARRVYPCLDELNFKSTLALNITHPPTWEAFFNTPVDSTEEDLSYKTTFFISTGSMETYMGGFVLAPNDDFSCNRLDNISSSLDYYQVCSKNEVSTSRSLVFDTGLNILNELNNFTSYKFGWMMGFPKLDLIALPELAPQSAENFGMITFREENLLYDEENSSTLDKQNILLDVAFRMAQMWFGNYNTQENWNYAYVLNGLSYYLQFYITEMIMEDWKLDDQFVVRVFQQSLDLDSLINSPNLRMPVNSTQEIISQLDKLSYYKGASLYRMLNEVMLEGDNFKKGIDNFITSFAKGNIEPQSLYNLIAAQINVNNRDLLPQEFYLKDVLLPWETLAGFPVLRVIRNGSDTLTVKQMGRFLYSGLDDSYQWHVPVSYAYSSSISDAENATLNQWLLAGETIEIPLPNQDEAFILMNLKSAGYYRVDYGDMWLNISSALLQPGFSGIPETNRAQLLNDLFALARAGVVKYSVVFELLKYLEQEVNLLPWMTVFDGFSYILRRVGSSTSLGLKIEDFLLELVSTVYNSASWTDLDENDHINSIKQIEILEGVCRLGYMDCVKTAVKQFQSFTNSGIRPNKNLRGVVYCSGFLFDAETSDWNALLDSYRSTSVAAEKVKILEALGCTENRQLLEQSLMLTLDGSAGIERQYFSDLFNSVYSNSVNGVDVSLAFLIENYRDIVTRYQGMNSLKHMVLGLAEHVTEEEQITKLKNFLLDTADLAEEIQIVSNQALEIMENNILWLNQHSDELKEYFQ